MRSITFYEIVFRHRIKKAKLIFKYIQDKQYDKIYQYVYNTKINIKPIKPINQKLIFVSVSYL